MGKCWLITYSFQTISGFISTSFMTLTAANFNGSNFPSIGSSSSKIFGFFLSFIGFDFFLSKNIPLPLDSTVLDILNSLTTYPIRIFNQCLNVWSDLNKVSFFFVLCHGVPVYWGFIDNWSDVGTIKSRQNLKIKSSGAYIKHERSIWEIIQVIVGEVRCNSAIFSHLKC